MDRDIKRLQGIKKEDGGFGFWKRDFTLCSSAAKLTAGVGLASSITKFRFCELEFDRVWAPSICVSL